MSLVTGVLGKRKDCAYHSFVGVVFYCPAVINLKQSADNRAFFYIVGKRNTHLNSVVFIFFINGCNPVLTRKVVIFKVGVAVGIDMLVHYRTDVVCVCVYGKNLVVREIEVYLCAVVIPRPGGVYTPLCAARADGLVVDNCASVYVFIIEKILGLTAGV